jgi:hypothetical protein
MYLTTILEGVCIYGAYQTMPAVRAKCLPIAFRAMWRFMEQRLRPYPFNYQQCSNGLCFDLNAPLMSFFRGGQERRDEIDRHGE